MATVSTSRNATSLHGLLQSAPGLRFNLWLGYHQATLDAAVTDFLIAKIAYGQINGNAAADNRKRRTRHEDPGPRFAVPRFGLIGAFHVTCLIGLNISHYPVAERHVMHDSVGNEEA